jgi:hypothetical protein
MWGHPECDPFIDVEGDESGPRVSYGQVAGLQDLNVWDFALVASFNDPIVGPQHPFVNTLAEQVLARVDCYMINCGGTPFGDVDSLAQFVWKNRSAIASIGAIAFCASTVGAGCLAAATFAWGVRSQQRDGASISSADVADGVLTLGTLGLVRWPMLAATRGQLPVVASGLGRTAITSGTAGAVGAAGFAGCFIAIQSNHGQQYCVES